MAGLLVVVAVVGQIQIETRIEIYAQLRATHLDRADGFSLI